jgi:hypothetical protein
MYLLNVRQTINVKMFPLKLKAQLLLYKVINVMAAGDEIQYSLVDSLFLKVYCVSLACCFLDHGLRFTC